MLTQDSLITATVETLAFGGQGIVKHEGMVIFVPFTAPGDRVTCRISKVKKNFAEAELVEIHQQSLLRVKPKCPYFGSCGGCQLQHMNNEAQGRQKHQWVDDALKRIGHIEEVYVAHCLSAEAIWGYRRHIHLNLKPFEKSYLAGYISYNGQNLLSITECPIFEAERTSIFKEIHELASRLNRQSHHPARVGVLKNEMGNYILDFHFKVLPDNIDLSIRKAMEAYPKWKGVLVSSPKKVIKYGQCGATTVIEGLKFHYSPEVFTQNHPEQSLKIYQKVLNTVLDLKVERVLDLYCGIGISSILLAHHGIHVTGIEYNSKSIELAKLNAKENQLQDMTLFYQGQVEDRLTTLLQKEKFDLLIINPPREGMDLEVVEAIKAYQPKELIYISCMPATLARDVARLSDSYTVNECQPFDMFPQTTHVETFVRLTRL